MRWWSACSSPIWDWRAWRIILWICSQKHCSTTWYQTRSKGRQTRQGIQSWTSSVEHPCQHWAYLLLRLLYSSVGDPLSAVHSWDRQVQGNEYKCVCSQLLIILTSIINLQSSYSNRTMKETILTFFKKFHLNNGLEKYCIKLHFKWYFLPGMHEQKLLI